MSATDTRGVVDNFVSPRQRQRPCFSQLRLITKKIQEPFDYHFAFYILVPEQQLTICITEPSCGNNGRAAKHFGLHRRMLHAAVFHDCRDFDDITCHVGLSTLA